MPSDTETELDAATYAHLRELAEAEGISIEKALRRAATDRLDRHDAGDDPLFTFHDDYEVPTSGRTDARFIEADLYGPAPGDGV